MDVSRPLCIWIFENFNSRVMGKSQIKLTPAARPRQLFLIISLVSLRLVDHQSVDREQKEDVNDESGHSLAEGSASSP